MTDSRIDSDSRRNFAPRHDFSFLFVISQILPQGKFWAYHDLFYANAPKAGPEHLKAFAQDVGLNLAAFVPFVERASTLLADLDLALPTDVLCYTPEWT